MKGFKKRLQCFGSSIMTNYCLFCNIQTQLHLELEIPILIQMACKDNFNGYWSNQVNKFQHIKHTLWMTASTCTGVYSTRAISDELWVSARRNVERPTQGQTSGGVRMVLREWI